MLTIFGASAVAAMPMRYALEARSPWFVFAFDLTLLWRLRLWMACGRVALRRHRMAVGHPCPAQMAPNANCRRTPAARHATDGAL